MSDHGTRRGFGLQIVILLLLVGGVILLHRFAVPSGVDPTAMLALGFIVLASYTIGELVGVIKLPHITGYLAAGFLFGPSVAHLLPDVLRFPPLDEGILDHDVITSLSVLDTLAIALIALTAGGELKIDGLRRGARTIASMLFGHMSFVFVLIGTFAWLVASGTIPGVRLPGTEGLGPAGALAVAAVIASVCMAPSPAAAIAVINGSGATGPMARTVLSTVVLMDVPIVIVFSVTSAIAAQTLGVTVVDRDLASYFVQHVVGSFIVGGTLGGALALYLRFVRREVLLVIVGVVYAATLLAREIHIDPILLFMAAGFTVSNFSREGDTLIHNVERLSLPVYVVFFTLAGARLHVAELIMLLPFAVGLFTVRLVGIRIGAKLGARIGRADEMTLRYGWMGFVAQAGVALSLAALVGQNLGETGRAIQTLIIAGIALNEMVGPVLLKVGLGLAGELPEQGKRGTAPSSEPATDAPKESGGIEAWPEPDRADPWGAPPEISSPALLELVRGLRAGLVEITRDVSRVIIDAYCDDADAYVRELRREYLRHHRRLMVHAKSGEDRTWNAQVLHAEAADLAERFRTAVLARSARVARRRFDALSVVESIDRLADTLPEAVRAPFERVTFARRPDDALGRSMARAWLRTRRRLRSAFRRELLRRVDARALARFHLSSHATQIEVLPAAFVQAEMHLAARTRSISRAACAGCERLADLDIEGSVTFEHRLRELGTAIEQELDLARAEVSRIRIEASRRLASLLGEGLRQLSEDFVHAGGPDFSMKGRRVSRRRKERVRAIDAISARFEVVQTTLGSVYSALALELELVGFEARSRDALAQHVTELEQDARGRSTLQAERVVTALTEAREPIAHALSEVGSKGGELAVMVRELLQPVEKIVGDANRTVGILRDQLSEEAVLTPLLEALRRNATTLAERYDAPEEPLAKSELSLPTPVDVMEVPLRELVTLHVEANVAPALATITRSLASKVQPLVTSLGEIERLLAFNVELAASELDVVHDETVSDATRALLAEMLIDPIDRSIEIARDHVEMSRAWAGEIGSGVRGAVLGGVAELRSQLGDGAITRERVDLLRRRARGRRLIQQAETLPTVIARARSVAARTFVALVGGERIDLWRRVLGLPSPTAVDVVDWRAFARPEPASRVPLVYRRLFVTDTLEAGDVLSGADMERARRALGGSKDRGRLRSLALVGLDGVGKGALATAIVRTLGARGVRRVGFRGPVTASEVDELLDETLEGQLFVVSGFHWLMGTRIGGFEALRHFVNRVIRDDGRNAWLLHADRLVWDFACQATPIADAFPAIIEVSSLSPAELEAAVLARHTLSGYGVSFEPKTERTRLEEIFARAAGRIRRPYKTYFTALHASSGGLVRDALRLWLASIDEVSEASDYVRVGVVPPPPHATLRRLSEDILLDLYQVARQGWMDAAVRAELYHVDVRTAEAQLSRLAHMGLLEAREQGAYRIPAHLRGSVYRVLRERGWVQ